MKFVAQPSELKVAETYIKAIKIIIPWKATPNYHNIFVNFAKFYEQGGVTSTVAPNLNSAQWAFEQGTKMLFRMTDKLAEVWCEWAEMEIHNEWVFCWPLPPVTTWPSETVQITQASILLCWSRRVNWYCWDHEVSAQPNTWTLHCQHSGVKHSSLETWNPLLPRLFR